MSFPCQQLTVLVLFSLALNTGTGQLTVIQDSSGGHSIHNLISTLLQRVKTPSLSSTHTSLRHADFGLETRPQNTTSPSTPWQGQPSDGSTSTSSNTVPTTFASSSFRGKATLDSLNHFHSVKTGQRNGVHVSPFLSLQSTVLSAAARTNRSEALHKNWQWNVTDEAGSEPSQNRSRRGAFPLLPNSYVDRQSYFTGSETCRQEELVHVLRPPGCLRRVVRTSSCQGTCHSRSVPHWDIDMQQLRHVGYCTCCKPHQLSYRRTRFRCPGRRKKVLVLFVGVATQCACRPCSEADPALQQPYDY